MVDNAMINGIEYDIYVATYMEALPSGASSSPSLLGFYIDSSLSNNNDGYYFVNHSGKVTLKDVSELKILVATQATQTTTFENPYKALNTVFGDIKEHHPWVDTPDGVTVSEP